MKFEVGLCSDIGRKRTQNQDACIAVPEIAFFMVSDGMGGHRGGETASSTAVQSVSEFFKEAAVRNPKDALIKAFKLANQAIYERSTREPELQGMGTTSTALLFKDEHLTIAHVGDSRCYFLRPNALWQATRDHSLVQERLRAGLITRQDARTDRMKNVITRSIGFEEEVNVEVYEMEVRPGDCFLICSDGLTGLVEDSKILEVVQKELFQGNQIQKAADALVAEANTQGGDDNITVILIKAA